MTKFKFESVYSDQQSENIAKEFKRAQGLYYLDHTGATLYSEKHLENIVGDFQNAIYANPHARNATNSKTTEEAIDIIRYRILDYFNTSPDEYSVVFTSGTTAALKLVAETFQFGKEGYLTYLETNHTSVLGMRAYAKNIMSIQFESAFELLSKSNKNPSNARNNKIDGNSNNLFVFPAMCNFSGTKYPQQWISNSQNGQLDQLIKRNNKITHRKGENEAGCHNWYVLLDAAAFVGTNTLNLQEIKPDFVTFSFYKLFGYPTGLGALLVRKSAEKVLVKSYLGGGTVLMALSKENVMIPRPTLHERFEDGTLPFLSILSLKHGFDTLQRLGLNMQLISKHTFHLARYFYKNLQKLHHGTTGKPVAVLYQDTPFEEIEFQGGIVNFNLLRDNGDFVGYSEVLHLANLNAIQLRTGCFCNPGACQRFLGLSTDDVKRQFEAGHVCGDQHDLVDGYPTGSIRISFGYMSRKEDADALLNLIESSFVSKPVLRKVPDSYNLVLKKYDQRFHSDNNSFKPIFITNINRHKVEEDVLEKKLENSNQSLEDSKKTGPKVQGLLKKIFLYPVKSCGAFLVKNSWPISATGLKFDRQWMIVNSSGVCVTQKQIRNLCLIRPEVDLKKNALTLNFPDWKPIEISLITKKTESEAKFCNSKICGDKIKGYDCGEDVANWLEDTLNISGLRLLQLPDSSDSSIGRSKNKLKDINNEKANLSLVNKAQYLMINRASVEWLKSKIPDGEIVDDVDGIVDRFRCNFLVDFEEAFTENVLDKFEIDSFKFQSGGKCTRCQMICINQTTGKTSKEPLATLAREFKGSIAFGLYLNQVGSENIDKNEIFVNSTIVASRN